MARIVGHPHADEAWIFLEASGIRCPTDAHTRTQQRAVKKDDIDDDVLAQYARANRKNDKDPDRLEE